MILLALLLLLPGSSRAGSGYQGWELSGFQLLLNPAAHLEGEDEAAVETLLGEISGGLALRGKRGFFGWQRPPFSRKLLAADRRRIALYMARRGFPWASTKAQFTPATDRRAVDLTLSVDPGSPVTIAEIRLSGVPAAVLAATDSITAEIPLQRRCTEIEIQGIGAVLTEAFRGSGYAHVTLNSSVILIDSTRARLRYDFISGRRYRFGEPRISGPPDDLRILAERSLSFIPGREYTPALIRRAQMDLRELQLFKRIDLATAALDDSTLTLTATLIHRRPRSTRISVGTWSDHILRLRGSWRHRNLFRFGRGVLLRGAWSPEQYEMEARTWWPGLPLNRARSSLTFLHEVEQEDSFYQRTTTMQLGLLFRPWRPWPLSWNFTIGYSLVDVDDLAPAAATLLAGAGDLLTVGLAYHQDRSDDHLEPGRGHRLHLSGEISVPGLLSDYPFTRVEGEVTHYRRIGFGVLALRAGAAAATPLGESRQLLPSKRLFAGGSTSMRGYRRRELGPQEATGGPLGGRVRLLTGGEIRWPLFSRFGLALFSDCGQVWESGDDLDLADLAVAGGGGLTISTPIGSIRGDIAFNLRDAPDEWLFHFSIGHPW